MMRMQRRSFLVGLFALLLAATPASAAQAPAEQIAGIVANPRIFTITADTVAQYFAPLVRLTRRATAPSIFFTDAGLGSSAWVRRAEARFAPDGRFTIRLEVTPSPELSLNLLSAAIEKRLGAPAARDLVSRRWNSGTEAAPRLLLVRTDRASDNGDNILVIDLLNGSA